jgi:hypothetical protein
MGERKSRLEQMQAVSSVVPQYPGKEAMEKVVAVPIRPFATKYATALIMRMIGYWHVWSLTPGGRAGIIDRGWMSRRAAYQAEADFRSIFGCSVEDFDPKTLPAWLLGPDDAPEATPDA